MNYLSEIATAYCHAYMLEEAGHTHTAKALIEYAKNLESPRCIAGNRSPGESQKYAIGDSNSPDSSNLAVNPTSKERSGFNDVLVEKSGMSAASEFCHREDFDL